MMSNYKSSLIRICAIVLICLLAAPLLTGCMKSAPVGTHRSINDLEGRRVGVMMGYGADVTVTALDRFILRRYPYSEDLPIALKAGNIEAFVMEQTDAERFVEEVPGLDILDGQLGIEQYVVVLHKDNAELGEEIDAALGELIA